MVGAPIDWQDESALFGLVGHANRLDRRQSGAFRFVTTNPEKPTCISIIICDEIYRDEQSKKLILVGTFNCINAKAVPCTHKRLSVLFTLTNARGQYELSLSIEHEQSGEVVAEIAGPLKIDNPLRISDFNLQLENVVFPATGKYWVVLKADGEILQQRPLSINIVSDSPDDSSGA